MDGPIKGEVEGDSEGDWDCEGSSDGAREGEAEGVTEGLSEGVSTEGSGEGTSEGVWDGFWVGEAEGVTETTSEGIAEGARVGHVFIASRKFDTSCRFSSKARLLSASFAFPIVMPLNVNGDLAEKTGWRTQFPAHPVDPPRVFMIVPYVTSSALKPCAKAGPLGSA